ncbi:MAG: M3 family metallopeptidase [Bacteroidales bacterium]|nr:M3 family metallopeptidase [Bacteroidales bacterium]
MSIIIISACNVSDKTAEVNPLLSKFDTKFNVPPFDKIQTEHYLPAFEEAIKQHDAEIEAIVNNTEKSAFENTVAAIDRSGILLSEVSNIFHNMNSANTNKEIQKIAKEVSPMLSKHNDNIKLNEKLFEKVKAVYDGGNSDLNTEQNTLLEKTYKNFVRGGANLADDKKERFREINKRLSELTLQFGENILNETNEFKMWIENKDDLAGLSPSICEAAAMAASDEGEEGKWLFTIHKPSLIPFLQYSEKRELREKMFKAYINQGNNNDKNDNKAIVNEIANLRLERALMLGYDNHADFILEDNMAKTPETIYNNLGKIWNYALETAKEETAELQKLIDNEGGNFKLKPWDWWYYAEKVKKAKYDLDENELRPYFKLENVRQGAFDVATNLYGIKFTELPDMPIYHEDVHVYEVTEADGSHIGILYMDFFPRASKRGGAWMTSFRKQAKVDGKNVTPVIQTVMNFSKPTADKPALISFEETTTLFHEFGHALHGLLSKCTYRYTSGTSVPRDFVELPSQIMENWAAEPEVMKEYAKHYETGKAIPQELMDKLGKSGHFNQGFVTLEYLSASFLDLDWHTIEENKDYDVLDFEKQSMEKMGMIPEIVVRYRSPYFRHIFAGGYSAGYYSYIWAAILDADAFQAFKETSLFDQETATAFRKNILEKGGTDDPMEMYISFRGEEPGIDALLKRKGFVK